MTAITQFQAPSFLKVQNSADLRAWTPWQWDQLTLGSCTAQADCADFKMTLARLGIDYAPSRLGAYYDSRADEGRIQSDGAYEIDALNAAVTHGIGSENTWGYVVENVNTAPPPTYYTEAAKHKVLSFEKIAVNPDSFLSTANAICGALSEGLPVLLTIKCPRWLFDVKGQLGDQDIIDTSKPGWDDIVGMHEVLVVGFDKSLNGWSYIFKNWWDPDGKSGPLEWGEHGYGALSVTLNNLISEAYVVTGVSADGKNYDLHWTPQRSDAAGAVIGLFNKGMTEQGLDYWASQLTGHTLADVAQAMYDCAPARAIYPAGITNTGIVNTFYLNALGRNADAGGLAYWSDQLAAGKRPGQVIVDMVSAVKSYAGTDAAALSSQALFDNKLSALLYNAADCYDNNQTIADHLFDHITADSASVEVTKTGIADQLHSLGWV